jgi:hypothetical protein
MIQRVATKVSLAADAMKSRVAANAQCSQVSLLSSRRSVRGMDEELAFIEMAVAGAETPQKSHILSNKAWCAMMTTLTALVRKGPDFVFSGEIAVTR